MNPIDAEAIRETAPAFGALVPIALAFVGALILLGLILYLVA